jgi:hypothetical protein
MVPWRSFLSSGSGVDIAGRCSRNASLRYERGRSAAVGGGGRQFQAKTEKLSANAAAMVDIQAELDSVVEMQN